MNFHSPVQKTFESEMSPEGYVIIPDQVRRATGLVPGRRLVVGINDQGDVVIMTRTRAKRQGETPAARAKRIDDVLESIGGRFSTGQPTAEVMEELRGSRAE